MASGMVQWSRISEPFQFHITSYRPEYPHQALRLHRFMNGQPMFDELIRVSIISENVCVDLDDLEPEDIDTEDSDLNTDSEDPDSYDMDLEVCFGSASSPRLSSCGLLNVAKRNYVLLCPAAGFISREFSTAFHRSAELDAYNCPGFDD
ncbi:hypothetical protein CONPUDRAFT_150904 [Coniophora puteana RWD-64-598 SS2]|uniref:Uncharacterized protein n=1 Tax=Coniophora puteana (strain RWD-64-598) TaxID=741705 RepID=A0A5M3MXM4_CONPW|nr:uncharacterized protein CONPUDRAFT_150904 [Coniophora puteana RWD-64-598 SS2]EIW83852.1 hypothetical protein CONPUDRAFT_150904 [Coniophora puteana RWD-64-598 SS2]